MGMANSVSPFCHIGSHICFHPSAHAGVTALRKNQVRRKENLRLVLIALFGATAGQGVVWYTGQFYALTFIQKTCSLEFVQSYMIIAVALVAGTPLLIFFGRLSDKVGRKY